MGPGRLQLVSATTLPRAFKLSAGNGSDAALVALGSLLADRIEATSDAEATAKLSHQLLAVLRELGWTPQSRGVDDGGEWGSFAELGEPTIRDSPQP